jgi:DNA-binding MltR family transcriptional regulator
VTKEAAAKDDDVRITKAQLEELKALVHTTVLDAQAGPAIVFVSALEGYIKIALSLKMPNIAHKKLEKTLFEGYGPLSTLRAKIDLAYALGLFNEKQHDDAQSIRKIRNNFAHTTKKLNFKTQLVIDNCKNLSTWDGARVDFDKVFDEATAALVAHLEKEIDREMTAAG